MTRTSFQPVRVANCTAARPGHAALHAFEPAVYNHHLVDLQDRACALSIGTGLPHVFACIFPYIPPLWMRPYLRLVYVLISPSHSLYR